MNIVEQIEVIWLSYLNFEVYDKTTFKLPLKGIIH